jgi:hypothetical protein
MIGDFRKDMKLARPRFHVHTRTSSAT